MNRIVLVLITVIVALAFFACRDDNSLEELRKNELKLLEEYINKNHPGAEPHRSGLYFFETEEGAGDTVKVGNRVQIYYATWLIDSTLVDESRGFTNGHRYEPYQFVAGGGDAIAGLEEAVIDMKTGGKANLVIPSELGYGQNGSTSGFVPGFATLLMQIEIYKVYPFNTSE